MYASRRFKAIVFVAALSLAALVGHAGYRASVAHAQNVADREAQLRAELDQVLREIAEQQGILEDEKKKGVSLERDIAILNAKIKEAKLNIRARELAIQGLGKDINVKTQVINTLTGKIEDGKDTLADLMRKTNEVDQLSLVDVVLSNENVSDFFSDVDAYDSIKQSIQVALGNIRKSKEDTEAARQTLDRKRLEEIDAKVSIEAEKKKIETAEREKNRLLSLSKEQQRSYQNEIKKRETRAAQIRSALFALRDSGAIPFGDALTYAQKASQQTGVRPAFLLAILTQESSLGKNVGSCYLKDPSTGSGVRISTGATIANVMKPSRDVEPFMQIVAAVGREPYSTRVSCPLSYGYGGAMGPSQFIPSTWKLMESRIAAAVGHAPDPWNAQDAFMASAIYLSNLGADAQTYSAEREAACRYYSGAGCGVRTGATSYGNSVMSHAKNIQTNMIDPLSGV